MERTSSAQVGNLKNIVFTGDMEFKFYFKFINNKLPHYLQILPFNRNTTHSHAARTQHNIRQMRPKHEYARKCIRYDLPILINNAQVTF